MNSLKNTFLLIVLFASFGLSNANAETKYYRWTNKSYLSDSLESILAQLNKESGLSLTTADFKTYERRDLANYRFTTFLQTFEGVPVKGAMIRTWVDSTEEVAEVLVQMEAHIEDVQAKAQRTLSLKRQAIVGFDFTTSSMKFLMRSLKTMDYVRQVVSSHPDDKMIGKVTTSEQWDGDDLQRVIKVKGRRGDHKIVVSHFSRAIVSSTYTPYPNADIQALVYPMYEETENTHKIQDRVPVTLKNLLDVRKKVTADPYESLRERHYWYDKYDPILGETPEGQAEGYWSLNWLINAAKTLYDALVDEENSFDNGGLLLQGRYATISLHPDVTKLKGIKFPLSYSGHLKFAEAQTLGQWELVPVGAFRGQALTDANSALARPAQRLPDHDAVSYINDGFDEVQVYYAVDRMMESLRNMGLSDPELSTRPFHAFLYDPDISMKDNAYYTADTINFTTYSPESQNFARDNSTVWHELGHGVMDRLMGDLITLADTGGLSEGMADYLAKLVVEDVTEGKEFEGEQDFRIINQTGFSLTNEVHDDGEAYGGAMGDMLAAAQAKDGALGIKKMTDLTLEAMRLTRNHPGLTANDWFEHMMFADQMGKAGLRAPGEMKAVILSSLASRNFNLDNSPTANFKIVVDAAGELTGESLGSRPNPYRVDLHENETTSHKLDMSLTSTPGYKFQYPVKVEVVYNGGPLQGAVRWAAEAAGTKVYTLNNESETVNLDLTATGVCDFINRDDGSCSDFVYIKVYHADEAKPAAKKRFYVRVKPLL